MQERVGPGIENGEKIPNPSLSNGDCIQESLPMNKWKALQAASIIPFFVYIQYKEALIVTT